MKGLHIRTVGRVMLASVLIGAMAIPTPHAGATGSTYTAGSATQYQYQFYTTARTITNPEINGPEVAFNQDYGPSGLQLGGWGCNFGNTTITGGGPFPQTPGVWEPVAFYPRNYSFCTVSYSNRGSGSFGGTVAWD